MLEVSKYRHNPILKPHTQQWEENNDIIFPSVLEAKGIVKEAMDDFYMYFAPHDDPGGIGLATSPSLCGPWKKYSANPVLMSSNSAKPGAHISSPHVVWNSRKRCLFMYYHGVLEWPGQIAAQATGIAFSEDGIRWNKMSHPVLDSEDRSRWDGNELSYARVTPLQNGEFAMLYMERDKRPGPPMLGMAQSHDGVKWEKASQPFLTPKKATQPFVSTGHLVEHGNWWFLFFVDESEKATNSTIHVMGSPDKGCTWKKPLKILTPGRFYQWDRIRVHDPYVIIHDNVIHLFYAGGARRKSNGIGLATLRWMDLQARIVNAASW